MPKYELEIIAKCPHTGQIARYMPEPVYIEAASEHEARHMLDSTGRGYMHITGIHLFAIDTSKKEDQAILDFLAKSN